MNVRHPVPSVVRFAPALLGILAALNALAAAPAATATATAAAVAPQPYEEEWVYRVKWGHEAEFWRLFQKNQIPLLDRERELGYILHYSVYRPGLHTSEDSRWTYRVIITFRDLASSTHEGEVEKQLFPDQAAYRQSESQRWVLVDAHYDLPIHPIDPHAVD